VHIQVPPLRQRREDVPALIEHFLTAFSRKHGRQMLTIDSASLALLAEYEFPGNVRELANAIERAVIVAPGQRVEASDLPASLRDAVKVQRTRGRPQTLAQLEAEYVIEILSVTKGNKTEAARILGISRKNLYERIARVRKDEGRGVKDEG
jgi:DNA-binding NtrC family response regulator